MTTTEHDPMPDEPARDTFIETYVDGYTLGFDVGKDEQAPYSEGTNQRIMHRQPRNDPEQTVWSDGFTNGAIYAANFGSDDLVDIRAVARTHWETHMAGGEYTTQL